MRTYLIFTCLALAFNLALGQGPCTGNVAIENLTNGMDYTITSDAAGNVDISVTVVDNPVGLVGFLGGAGNPISFPDANGTFIYNLTGIPVGSIYNLDIFFNWAGGGQGNSETVSVIVNGSCMANPAVLDLPIDFDDAAVDYELAPFGSNMTAQLDADPTDPGNMVLSTTKTAGADCWSGVTVGDSGLANSIGFTATTTTFTMDVYSPEIGVPILLKVEDASNGAISSEVISLTTVANTWETLTFNFANGCANPPNLANTYDKISIFPEFTCDPDACGGANPGTAPDTDNSIYFDNIEFDGGSGPTILDPSLPIDFGDAGVDYALAPFGSNINAQLDTDPTDPTNEVLSTTKTAGADCWSGVTIGGSGLENAIPFTATDMSIIMDVYSPVVGAPILLKVEDATNGAISSEVIGLTTVANAWETLEFDFTNGCANPPNLANTYDKISIFPEFTCDPDACGVANPGTAPDSDEPFYFDNIIFASLPDPCSLTSGECVACGTCEESVDVDLTSGGVFNLAQQFGPGFCCFQENTAPTYDPVANTGTFTMDEGAVNAFSVGGVDNLELPDYITDICLTADINVISGSYPFLLEFRLENGTGAPGNGGQAMVFDVMVDGSGVCSMGGTGSVNGTSVNGFTYVPGAKYAVAVGLADFSGNPVASDVEVEVSNISLTVCAADNEAPVLNCPNSEELLVNGDFSGIDVPSAFPAPANFSVWGEFGDTFEDVFTLRQTLKLFGGVSGVFQDALIMEGDWLCSYADFITQSLDNIVGTGIWGEVKIEFYDASGVIINGPLGTVLGDFNQTTPATADVWTKVGGCIQAPEGAVTARTVIIFLNFNGDQGAIVVDNATTQKINPTYFEANVIGCNAEASIANPIPTDDCGVVTFTNTYNGTDDASGIYPEGMTLVTYTAVDINGNESCCSILVEVGDMTGPDVDCPSDIFVQLEAGECEEIVFFDIPFTDNCETMDGTGSPTIEQTEGLPSGSFYPKGTTTNTFIVTDVNGNSTECSFDVTMVEFENGVTGTMACNDNINVSLDMDCEVVLGADMLLEGDVYGCYNDFIIEVSGGVVGNVITEEGTYTVTITDPETGNSCWSTINVEDKQVPTIEDCSCPVGGSEVMTPFVGTLDETDPIWTRPFVAGGVCNPSLTGVNIPYDTYNFSLDMDANLGAEVVTFTAPSGDSFLCLYEDSFDPTDPCGNLVITNDDGGVGLLSQFDVMLNSGVEYILVVTTFNNNGNDFGDYVVEITSEATLLELAEECNFRCVDVEYIFGSDELTPNPTITSCSSYEAFISDELTEDANGNPIILRTWLAVNENGSSTCTQQFNIAPIAIDELRLPINPVLLSCNDGTSPEEIVAIFDNPLTLDNPNTSFVENNEGFVYAYPTYDIDGHPQKVDNQVCDVYAAYTDQELDACGEGCNGNRKVIRTWTLVDWNTLEISTFIQTIKAVDTEAPTLETQDITVSTDAWGCEASFEVPSPWELHDNCDSSPRYSVSGPAGIAIGGSFENGYVAIGVPKGSHTFAYIAYDCCGNEASYPFEVRVVDLSPPVVVAKQNVVISLTSGSTSADGLAKLYAESIDNGSYDGCTSEVRLEVRRDEDNCDVRGNATYNADGHPEDGSPNPNSPSYDPDGGAFVKFCCADLTNAVVDVDGDGELDAGYVKVWLRVWDDGDMDGIYGTAGDNFNEAWAYVKVEDKLAPSIQCPPDVTLTCDMDYTDLNMTGSASAFGSCGSVDVEYNDIIINLNSCNEGFVRRRWSVVNRSDIFCDQTITLEDLDIPVTVSFAQVQDFTAANCPAEIALGEPTWVAGPCDVLGYTLETDTFRFEDGACYKLVNNWTVINWCDYEPNNPFWNGEGLWEHIQIVRVTDETQPVLEDCEDKMYEVNDHSDSDDDGDVCEAKITLTNVASDPGSENCPTGWLKWQVLVDLWGDGTDDLEYSSFLPPFDNQLNDTNGNGIPDMYVSPTANGETVSIPLPDIAGSMSNHKVVWKVTDGCNNVTSCDTEFMVVDKKGPTPYCVNLSTAVMESSGTVELWAIDFNVGSFDNCTAEEDLRYTFTSTPPEDDPNYDEAQYSSSMIFDCGDVENSPVEVNMYVWDEKGNADFCVVFLTLVDNSGACGGKPDIAGKVATEGGLGVEEVEVKLEANLPEYPRLEMTDDSGDYLFEANALNGSYQLSGSKDVDYLNGVSTLDLVKIQRHILGLESLDSPYKLIAADVNGDDDVKASDLTELRKLILGVITDLPTNESWRFVDGEQELSMDMDLADVDYTQEIENLEGNTMSKDFVGVKIGDVTEDASANLASNSTAVVRSNKRLSLSILNQEVVAGQGVSVDFTSEDFESVFGYQFTLEFKGLEFVGIEDGAVEMREEHVGVLTENVLTMSYHNTTGLSVAENEEIFTVQFVAKETGMLSNMLDITSKVTRSEAYVSTSPNGGETLEVRDVVIEVRGGVAEGETTALYQNEPNPFDEITVIGFDLGERAGATLTVFDVTGKVILKKNIDGVKGYNTVNLAAKQLGTSGVLYYTLESGDFTATKKMIVIE